MRLNPDWLKKNSKDPKTKQQQNPRLAGDLFFMLVLPGC
jgi:hypothetical protein